MERVTIVKALVSSELLKIALYKNSDIETKTRLASTFIRSTVPHLTNEHDISISFDRDDVSFVLYVDGEAFAVTINVEERGDDKPVIGTTIVRELIDDIIEKLEGRYCLVIYEDTDDPEIKNVHHIVAYTEMPGFNDIISLKEELIHDKEFGCHDADRVVNMKLMIYPIDIDLPDNIAGILETLI